MYINKGALLSAAPIRDMETSKCTSHGLSYGLSELGYDIRLDQDIKFFPGGFFRQPYVMVKDHKGRVFKQNGSFTLASSMEYFQMPAFLGAEVKDKSTHARKGIQLYNTVIEPGWHGYLTLKINFHGSLPVYLPRGVGIAQVLFMPCLQSVFYNGKYQFQERGAQQARYKNGL